MRAPPYSTQLFSESPLIGGHGFTVPDGAVIVLRDMDVWEASATGSTSFTVGNASGGLLWAVEGGTTFATRYFQWRGRQVFIGGQFVEFNFAGGTWEVQASGYVLTAP